ncbi:MAG: efflux RND transporter periplasmic adaptor subunit [Deltaproteobacteria bacterium]|nr:efflux RND transporter periplasmic adaptor subunit [Deltaproteobacteria bacterium]
MNPDLNPASGVAETLEMHRSPGLRKRWKRYAVIALVVTVAVVTAAVLLRMGGKSTVIQYKTEQVRRGDLTVIVTATGTLQPTNKVDVGSELSGTIRSVEADYNSTVKVGQVLVRLDTSKLEATITQSRAALDVAKAKVLQAQATVMETRAKLAQLQKVRELSNGKVPSQSEMDAALAAFDRAKADAANYTAAVSQAQATLQVSETDLSKSVIRSPINGIVLTRSVEPGQTLAASMTTPVLFTLAENLALMDLHVNVDEADVGKVQEGQEAIFSVAAYPNRTFAARIIQARYGSSTTSGVVTYETVLKVGNPDLSLRPGMTATAEITVKKLANAILIPSAALRFTPPLQPETKTTGGLVSTLLPRPPSSGSPQLHDETANKKQQRVWVLRNNQLASIPVTIGSSNGSLTEVVSGDIQPGMEIIVDVITGGK